LASSTAPLTEFSSPPDSGFAFRLILGVAVCHLCNDMVQSLLPAMYPVFKTSLSLSFAQLGVITLGYQLTASLLQPLVGTYTDRRPSPSALPIGMSMTLCGLIFLAFATSFSALLGAAALVGAGSAVFHPESSRVARSASGGRHGFAQSMFQVGGNAGSALGPLLATLVLMGRGQRSLILIAPFLLPFIYLLFRIGRWRGTHQIASPAAVREAKVAAPRQRVGLAITILVALVFSKYFYLASLTSYYTFYLMTKFHTSLKDAQLHLFLFLAAAAVGTVAGGPIGDRIGRKPVIWISILGVLPFSLVLPFANLFWTTLLTIVIGLILASAFSAIVVFAQELMPGRIGMISGLFFGLAFGMGGLGAAILGLIADHMGIVFVYQACAFLPAIGLLTAFLPNLPSKSRPETPDATLASAH
jgi:MFS transporter, FSR family, fosmidomycin resistance protein